MNFQKKYMTEVKIAGKEKCIKPEQSLFFMGSCFSDALFDSFEESNMRVMRSPFGQVYNPCSMGQLLGRLATGSRYSEKDIFEHKGLWRHFDFHSRVAHSDRDEFFYSINNHLSESSQFIKSADWLILTLGTSWGYFLKDMDSIVNNCHTLPGNKFVRRLLSLEEMRKSLGSALSQITTMNPDIKIILTVSPVRHLRDSFRENTLSKSMLHLLVNELSENHNISLFPAFEIMIDELRDYRWYKDDLVHPSSSAVEYIKERFLECFGSKELHIFLARLGKWLKAEAHKPFFPESMEYQAFRDSQQKAWQKLAEEYPFIKKTVKDL